MCVRLWQFSAPNLPKAPCISTSWCGVNIDTHGLLASTCLTAGHNHTRRHAGSALAHDDLSLCLRNARKAELLDRLCCGGVARTGRVELVRQDVCHRVAAVKVRLHLGGVLWSTAQASHHAAVFARVAQGAPAGCGGVAGEASVPAARRTDDVRSASERGAHPGGEGEAGGVSLPRKCLWNGCCRSRPGPPHIGKSIIKTPPHDLPKGRAHLS